MNNGKLFEKLIENSCKKQDINHARFKDAGFTGIETAGKRFTIRNICDCILFNSFMLAYIEIKHTQGNSIPISRLTQQKALYKRTSENKTRNVEYGYILRFDSRYFYCRVKDIQVIINNTEKKSINAKELEPFAIEIQKYEIRKAERLDIKKMFEDITERWYI